jgi:UTP--glucose-1-phosphate uridylyltransferase
LLQKERILAYRFRGKRYDAGEKLGFLQATVEFALKNEDVGPGFRAYLKSLTSMSDRNISL